MTDNPDTNATLKEIEEVVTDTVLLLDAQKAISRVIDKKRDELINLYMRLSEDD